MVYRKLQKSQDFIHERISKKFFEEMKIVSLERINRKLANPFNRDEISIREMTDLTIRAPSWKKVLEELKTLPKKKDDII